jgi:flagellar motor switch protein FliG
MGVVDSAAVRAAAVLADLGREQAARVLRYLDDRAVNELLLGAEFWRQHEGRTDTPQESPVLSRLRRADPATLGAILTREQPQTVAVVLGLLSAERAASVIAALPEASRALALTRLSTLERVNRDVLDLVVETLVAELDSVGELHRVEGSTRTVALMGGVHGVERERVMAAIEREDPRAAESLRALLVEAPVE